MLKTQMADLFQVRNRFFRSTHLERDFSDPDALNGYVITPSAKTGFERLAGGLASHSTQRAWRLTGDFGTGKSSFALALARLFGGDDTNCHPNFDGRLIFVAWASHDQTFFRFSSPVAVPHRHSNS